MGIAIRDSASDARRLGPRLFSSFAVLLQGLCLCAIAAATDIQPEIFKARLSPLGVTAVTVNVITGAGAVVATLDGSRLSIDVTFEGLTGAATDANIRRGAKGIPGPVMFAFPAPKTSGGKIHATFDLNAEQLADLRAGRLYVQIHSERAPEGSIRGWLLK